MLRIQLNGEQSEPVHIMKLKLERCSASSIDLIGEDGTGQSYIIANIDERGIVLYHGIPAATGWPLTDSGRLMNR